jgi:hypothetical protein
MVWLGIAGVVLLLTGTWPAIRRLLRARVVQLWGGVVGLCILFELAWTTFNDALGSKDPPGVSAKGLSDFEILKETFGSTRDSYRQMIGVFGWLDTPRPSLRWRSGRGRSVSLSHSACSSPAVAWPR